MQLNKHKRKELDSADKTLTTSITITRRQKTRIEREKLNLSSLVRQVLDQIFPPTKNEE